MIQGYAIAALVAVAIGFGAGWKAQGWRCAAADAERVRQEQQAAWARVRAADRAAGEHERDKAANRVEFRTITQEVERVVEKPVYLDRDCLDADGLRVLGAAIAGRGDGAAGQPAGTVRGAGGAR